MFDYSFTLRRFISCYCYVSTLYQMLGLCSVERDVVG